MKVLFVATVMSHIGHFHMPFIRKLKELNYDSWMTIEREILGDQQNVDIVHARDYLTEIINEVYGG